LFFFQNAARDGTPLGNAYKEINTIKMDVLKMLAELRHEREQIEEAILTLERLSQGRVKRRGRPPAWMATVKRRGRPPGSKNKVKEIAAA
jgi:septal ring factor EnvC (AmiA/AmiB activator)